MIKIIHGVFHFLCPTYRNTNKMIINLPNKFKKLILNKHSKFIRDLIEKNKPLEFTFGLDEKTNISAIAIVHPKDNFSRKIGNAIVKGRINRIKYGKKYNILPQYVDSPPQYNFRILI